LADTRGFEVFDEAGIIVGALIFASDAGEIIAEAALPVRVKLKIEDVYHTISHNHAHPTLPESFVEAARDVNNNASHLPYIK
jgi:dihydrolipoamide dehydrogenase